MTQIIDIRASLAMSKGATTIAEGGALLTDQGVPLPLDKGDLHVLVLAPVRCCDHHATRGVPPETDAGPAGQVGLEFDTAEHIITVADVKLHTLDGDKDALTQRLHVFGGPKETTYTYGQIIALGGDFYGDPDNPICEAGDLEAQIGQFWRNFAQLAADSTNAKKILEITHRYEFEPIKARVAHGQVPSGAYENIPWTKGVYMNDEDQEFDQATGGGGPNKPGFGRYTKLAEKNFDHFGTHAKVAWTAGHTKAQRLAVQARALRQGSEERSLALEYAYAANAFADHFLTDLFAAGHMRTPRKELYEADVKGGAPRISSGYCVKGMHDEDNKFGLHVRNKLGDRWVAYGDARYRDFANAANRRIMKLALQQSIDDVWNAFQTGTIADPSKVFDYLPTIIDESRLLSVRGDRQNWAPLFWADSGGYVYQRGSVASGSILNLRDYDNYSYNWAIHYTGPYLRNRRKGPYMDQHEYESAGFPYPPNEKGPSGEVGWPAGPTALTGYARVTHGATGPHLRTFRDWNVDKASEPQAGA